MSDEEKKAIEMLRNYDNEDNLYKIHQLINVILNLIEKQQKEIEELKKPKYVINCKTNEITKLTNDFVSNDKIKAKIEEIDEVLKGQLIEKIRVYFEAQKEVLQSLLEKE